MATGDVSPFWNKSCCQADPTADLARICWKFAWGGWRLATQPGVVYPGTTGGHADQAGDYRSIPVLAGQKLDVCIHLGTNDEHEYNIGLLHGSPAGGSPNLIADGLAPLVQLLRAQLPVHRVGVVTPIARWTGGTAMDDFRNAAFSAMADWLISGSNAASIGVDAVSDSRNDPNLDCRDYKQVTLNTFVYQIDRTHLTPLGYVDHLGPLCTALLDQFWDQP
jgi:hypothetical protein